MKKKKNVENDIENMQEDIQENTNANNKRNRLLIAFGVTLMFIISWYYLFNESSKKEKQYNQYIEYAHYYEKKELYKKANIYYSAAKEMNNSLDLQCEIANMYYSWGKYYAYEDMIEEIITNYKYSNKGYDLLLKYYYDDGNYSSCMSLINTAKSRKVTSDYLTKVENELKYKFEYTYSSYPEVDDFFNNMCRVQDEDGKYGIVYSDGTMMLSCVYMQLSPFIDSESTPMTVDGTKYWFIDKTGEAVDVAELPEGTKIEEIGTYSEGLLPVKMNGKYCYTNTSFKKQFGDYEEAYAFNNGKAMVKDESGYYLIDNKGKKCSKKVYKEIKTDELGYASRSGIYAVKTDDKFYLIDNNEKKIGSDEYDDARLMSSDEYMAVKKDDKWGFVDSKGKVVIKPQYVDASSFSNGLAAVNIDGKWGYIDKSGKVVIEQQFDGAKNFSTGGSAFVLVEDKWQMIKLYR